MVYSEMKPMEAAVAGYDADSLFRNVSLLKKSSVIFNFACINFLPLIFGYEFVWYTVTVSECICMAIAMVLCRISEKNGIVYR